MSLLEKSISELGLGRSILVDKNNRIIAGNGEHPTMKPIGLFGYQIENSSKVGDIVIDAFGGSGTTMVACEQLNRKARLIEYDPKYCQVIIDRMLKLNPALKIKKNGSIYEHTMKEGNDGTV